MNVNQQYRGTTITQLFIVGSSYSVRTAVRQSTANRYEELTKIRGGKCVALLPCVTPAVALEITDLAITATRENIPEEEVTAELERRYAEND